MGKFIKLFSTTTQYNNYVSDEENFITPNVSLCKDAPTVVHYNPFKLNINPSVSLTGWTYGNAANEPILLGNLGGGTVTYYYKLLSDNNWSTTKPTNAGIYNVRADIAETKRYKSGTCLSTFIINKANSTYIAPTAKSPLIYSGSAQELINVGSTSNGEIKYSTNGTSWSTSIPSGTNAGNYTVYWKLDGGINYTSVDSTLISGVSIAKATRTISFTSAPTEVAPGDTITVSASPSAGSGDGTITFSSSDTSIATVSGSTVTGVTGGTVTITATISQGTNYNSASTSYTLTVESNVTMVTCIYNVHSQDDTITLFYKEGPGSGSGNGSGSDGIVPFSAMEIDGVEQSEVVNEYTFDTVGEHTVKYTLIDPTRIGSNAFYGCRDLTSIVIPNSVTSIGNDVFHSCTNLTSVTIPNSVTNISYLAFYYCTSLTSIVIPNSVTIIDNNAFYNCSGLTSITIGSGVTSIGGGAFASCSGLASITIPSGVTSIGSKAFILCSGLTSIDIPSGVTSIGDDAFEYCSGLTSITVNSNNTVYDSRNNCNAIINTSTNKLIQGCKNTTIPNNVTSIGNNAFIGCTGLTSVTIPNSVTSIGTLAFSQCSGLTTCIIGSGVRNISNDAFSRCSSLTNVTIGSGVISIGSSAFYNCSSLTSIVCNATTAPTIYFITFQNIKTGGTLTVPSGSTGYDTWMQNANYYLGLYNWTKVEQ